MEKSMKNEKKGDFTGKQGDFTGDMLGKPSWRLDIWDKALSF